MSGAYTSEAFGGRATRPEVVWDPGPLRRHAIRRFPGQGHATATVLRAEGIAASFDAEPLHRHIRRTWTAIRRHAHELVRGSRAWATAFDAGPVRRAYGDEPQREGHFLLASPLDWGFSLTEPQVTGALKHFLNAAPAAARRRAFLEALGGELDETADLETATVEAEAPTGRGRIDLLIRWRDAYGRQAAVVEAKFGHSLGVHQLSGYRRKVVTSLRIGAPLLVVVGRRRRASDERRLRRNKDWRFRSWRDVLLAFERGLARHCPADEDTEFARFRHTLWLQT